MNIVEFITELYCKIDDALPEVTQHSQAVLSISELVTIGILHAIKNVSRRAFYHWLKDNYGHLFPKLPERTRLFRRLQTQSCWTGYFLAQPTILGIADSYGVELCHPVCSGRDFHQAGKKGKSNHRWPRIGVRGDVIVGGKLCIVINQLGLITDWDCRTAPIVDQSARPDLPAPAGTLRRTNDHPDRHRLSPRQGRPGQRQDLPTGRVERAHGSGNHLFHDDHGMGQQGDATFDLARF